MLAKRTHQHLRARSYWDENSDQKYVLEQVRHIVDERVEKCDPTYETAVVMVAALFVGSNVEAIVGLTGCARDFVESIASRMRASSVWTDDGVDYEDWFSGDALRETAAFVLDLGVAEGKFIRTGEKTSSRSSIYMLVDYKVC